MKILFALFYTFGVLSGMVILPLVITPNQIVNEINDPVWEPNMTFYNVENDKIVKGPDFFQNEYCNEIASRKIIIELNYIKHIGLYCEKDIVLLLSTKIENIPIINYRPWMGEFFK